MDTYRFGNINMVQHQPAAEQQDGHWTAIQQASCETPTRGSWPHVEQQLCLKASNFCGLQQKSLVQLIFNKKWITDREVCFWPVLKCNMVSPTPLFYIKALSLKYPEVTTGLSLTTVSSTVQKASVHNREIQHTTVKLFNRNQEVSMMTLDFGLSAHFPSIPPALDFFLRGWCRNWAQLYIPEKVKSLFSGQASCKTAIPYNAKHLPKQ